MQLQYLDGKRFKAAINAGWNWLHLNRERLNAINVYPVADGDTGTNMAITLQCAVAGANSVKSNHLNEVAEAVALHSLNGARGNSGVILSQYFNGVAEYIGAKQRLRMSEIAAAFKAGAESAYTALKEPREGTILTVIREIAEHLQQVHDKCESLSNLMESAIERGKKSVESTRYMLKVLTEARVVDAGGQGFLHFIEGIGFLIKNGGVSENSAAPIPVYELPSIVVEHSRYRFCSEFLVHGNDMNINKIKNDLDSLGDSLIVAAMKSGKRTILRIHIHTDAPEHVEQYSNSIGTIESKKIEDMQAQNRAMIERQKRSTIRKKTIKIVTDSTCDLPPDIIARYGIEVVPLKVSFGDSTYLDGQTLSTPDFYSKLRVSEQLPKTSQPSPGDFAAKYISILQHHENVRIISIHLSSKLSGTLNSAMNASANFKNDVMTFDTSTVSLGLGLMAIIAAEMAADGQDDSKIIQRLEALKKTHKLYLTLDTLDYLIKGGRIGKAKGFIAKILGYRPILAIEDGQVVPVARAKSEIQLMKKIRSFLPRSTPDTHWAIAHADASSKLPPIRSMLRDEIGAENILEGFIGPAVGSHAGPGTWGVICMRG